jgi:hypothetical protein
MLMYGIAGKPAAVIAAAAVALGIAGFDAPVEASDKHRGSHFTRKIHGPHGTAIHHRPHSAPKHHATHSIPKHKPHGTPEHHGDYAESEPHHDHGEPNHQADAGKPKHPDDHRKPDDHADHRKPDHPDDPHHKPKHPDDPHKPKRPDKPDHDAVVDDWRPAEQRPSDKQTGSACHRVIRDGYDESGRRAEFGGTMCHDRNGQSYIVPGSRHVIRTY